MVSIVFMKWKPGMLYSALLYNLFWSLGAEIGFENKARGTRATECTSVHE